MRKLLAIVVFLVCLSGVASATTITNLQLVAQTGATATITWTTDVPSSTQLFFGTGQQFNQTPIDHTLVTSHSVTLTGVGNATSYNYYAVSVDAGNNKGTSATQVFTVCTSGTGLTNVQGTVNNYYEYGTYIFNWVPPSGFGGTPTLCGQPLTQTYSGNLDQGASVSRQIPDSNQIVPSPSQWQVTVAGVNGVIGSFNVTQAITPQGNNITAALQAGAQGNLLHCWYDPATNTSYPTQCGSGGGGGSIGGSVSPYFVPYASAPNVLSDSAASWDSSGAGTFTLPAAVAVNVDSPIMTFSGTGSAGGTVGFAEGGVPSQVSGQPCATEDCLYGDAATSSITDMANFVVEGNSTIDPQCTATSSQNCGSFNGVFRALGWNSGLQIGTVSGGSGYSSGQIATSVTMVGATCSVPPVIGAVGGASGGLNVNVISPGVCSVAPTSLTFTGLTAGSGWTGTYSITPISYPAFWQIQDAFPSVGSNSDNYLTFAYSGRQATNGTYGWQFEDNPLQGLGWIMRYLPPAVNPVGMNTIVEDYSAYVSGSGHLNHPAVTGTSTYGMFTGSPVNTHCVDWVVSGGVTTLGDAGAACGSGGGGVTSVSNSDGTLTISPTTGAVVASLALGHANTWTATQTFSGIVDSGITTTPSTSPICPNGTGGLFTTSGCASGVTFEANSTPLSNQTTINYVGAGTATVTNPSAGEVLITSTGTPLVPAINPPSTSQHVTIYSTANDSGGGCSGPTTGFSVVASPGTGGRLIECTWSGFLLPAGVSAGSVTAVYPYVVASIVNSPANASGCFGPIMTTNIGAGIGLSTPPFTYNMNPGGGTNYAGNFTTGQTPTVSTSLTGAQVATTEVAFSASGSACGDGGVWSIVVSTVALVVYYTGSPVPQPNNVLVEGPLTYNPLTSALGIDLTQQFPASALIGTTVANALAIANTFIPGSLIAVYDGINATDCATGGGSTESLCKVTSAYGLSSYTLSGSSSVNVNGSGVTSPNFNGTTPAAGTNSTNVLWQFSGSSISAAVPYLYYNGSFLLSLNPTATDLSDDANTCIGVGACNGNSGSGNNAVLGVQAFQNDSSGSIDNVFIGVNSGRNGGQYTDTVIIGEAAVSSISGTSNSVYIGQGTGASIANATNCVVVGQGMSCPASNTAILGTTATTETFTYGIKMPGTVFSHAGTALPTCASSIVGSTAAVSDATSLTPGTAYSPSAGAGSDTVQAQCTLTGSTYAWQTM